MTRFTQRNSKGQAVCRGITVSGLVECTEIVGGEAIERFADLEDKIKKQAVKEFAGKMKAEINGLLSVEFIGKTRKQVYQRKGMDEGLQTANEILDDLITELYGADE